MSLQDGQDSRKKKKGIFIVDVKNCDGSKDYKHKNFNDHRTVQRRDQNWFTALNSNLSSLPKIRRSQSNETEPKTNRTQSFDGSSIGSAIEHNRTGTFFVSSIKFDYRTQSNSIDAIGSILFGRKTKWYTKSISINS